jgi:ATP-dependent helicase HrpA/adenine-specific DNA-methyltransferase
MRKNPTPAEAIVWRWLRDRRFGGWKFRRQHPIGTYILDFYCEALHLAIELDGLGHLPNKDWLRTLVLRKFRIKVIRLTNDDVIRHSDRAAEHIANAIEVRARSLREAAKR